MTIPHHRPRRRASSAVAVGAAAALALAACASADAEPASSDASATESGASGTRLALTTDGGVVVLDAETLEPVGDAELDGFLRLNPAGDGEHVFVTSTNGFEVLATGASSGDEPALTGAVFEADAAGHVVLHEDRTVLFDDATGAFWAFDSDALGASDAMPEGIEEFESESAHHGVAVELADGTMLSTLGDEESRVGVRAVDPDGSETARFEECPSVHGEGVAADEVVLFGCEDGVLLYADGAFQKLDSPDAFGRVGNAYVTDESPIAFVDYKDDPDAEGVLLHRLGVVDTEAGTWEVVDLPEGVEYTWQGVDRDEHGDAWLIGTDGSLHRLDGQTGAVADSYPVIEAWEGPAEWQEPHPSLAIDGHTAWVTEPASNAVHRIDLETGEVVASGELESAPGEMALAG